MAAIKELLLNIGLANWAHIWSVLQHDRLDLLEELFVSVCFGWQYQQTTIEAAADDNFIVLLSSEFCPSHTVPETPPTYMLRVLRN